MCIPFSVAESPGKGLGVFAEANVPAGETVWQHVPGNYQVLDEDTLTHLLTNSSHERAVYLLTHIVGVPQFPDYMVNVFDEGALINHSDRPNVSRKPECVQTAHSSSASIESITEILVDQSFDLIASRDIVAGEELLMDYNAEPDEPEYCEQAYDRYGVSWDWL